jgi:hypothetical protein
VLGLLLGTEWVDESKIMSYFLEVPYEKDNFTIHYTIHISYAVQLGGSLNTGWSTMILSYNKVLCVLMS